MGKNGEKNTTEMLRLVTFVHRQHIVIGPTIIKSEEKRFQNVDFDGTTTAKKQRRITFVYIVQQTGMKRTRTTNEMAVLHI